VGKRIRSIKVTDTGTKILETDDYFISQEEAGSYEGGYFAQARVFSDRLSNQKRISIQKSNVIEYTFGEDRKPEIVFVQKKTNELTF